MYYKAGNRMETSALTSAKNSEVWTWSQLTMRLKRLTEARAVMQEAITLAVTLAVTMAVTLAVTLAATLPSQPCICVHQ